MNFLDRATLIAAQGVPVIRLRPKTKIAFDPDWPALATTDVSVLEKWNAETPDANCASVAQAKLGGFWFWEVDRPEVTARVEAETGNRVPRTFRVRSSPGRGHFYFKQTVQSLAMSNISQGFVKGGDWSARVDSQYVVSANSLHPKTGEPYIVASKADIVEAPEWLITWLISQKIEKKPAQKTAFDDGEIITGARNTTLASIAGRMRQVLKATEEQIYDYISNVNETRCSPPLDDDEIHTIAASIGRYAVKDETVLIGGVPAGTAAPKERTAAFVQSVDEVEPVSALAYPKFPLWAIQGTSIYENFCKPTCDQNSRYPEFMWLPAMVIMLNYLGTKVRISMKGNSLSLFAVLIGRKGRVFKSACVQDAIRYFQFANVADHARIDTRSADAKSLVWTAGSPEGLGLDMQKTQCRNAILFYDELSALVSKASIESSSMKSALLLLYESGKFGNSVKSKKEQYSIDPGTYCASLMACCTETMFTTTWGKLSGKETGLDDRFFFLLQPETLKEVEPQTEVPFMEGAAKTKLLIDKAVSQGVYSILDPAPLSTAFKADNRTGIRAEKFALGFAIDLGREEIDEDCIERASAIAAYEVEVKKYFGCFEYATKEGEIQQKVIQKLRMNGTVLTEREVNRQMHPMQYGTTLWNKSVEGLARNGWLRIEGSGKKGDPRVWHLIRAVETED